MKLNFCPVVGGLDLAPPHIEEHVPVAAVLALPEPVELESVDNALVLGPVNPILQLDIFAIRELAQPLQLALVGLLFAAGRVPEQDRLGSVLELAVQHCPLRQRSGNSCPGPPRSPASSFSTFSDCARDRSAWPTRADRCF